MIFEDIERWEYLKREMRSKRKAYNNDVKPIKDEMALLEASIKDEVMKTGQTLIVGNVKVEFVPTVVIRMKKEKEAE